MVTRGSNSYGLPVIVGVTIAYYLLSAGAIAFTRLSDNVALLWIANAPLLTALLIRPAAERPLYLMGCFAASIAASLTVSPYTILAPMFAIANVSEALIAWLLLRRLRADARPLQSMQSLAAFVLCAGIAAPAISGILPTIFMGLIGNVAPLVIWSNWTLGHALGALVGTPLALMGLGGAAYRDRLDRPHALRRFVLAAVLVGGVTALCFGQTELPLLFVPILPLVIATMMFRFAGAALGVFLIAVIGAVLTMGHVGPVQLINGTQAFHLQFFQFYLAVLFLTAFPFATMISQNHRLAKAVEESEARYRMIAEHVSDAVITLDPAGRVLFASPSVRELAGFDPALLIGQSSFDFIVDADRERMRASHYDALLTPDTIRRMEFRAMTGSGTVRWYESTARGVRDEDGQVSTIITVVRDLSQRKAREADLERQAATDPMTGVLNRRAFQAQLADHRAQANGRQGALALFDLDHFKQINDNFGHHAGDNALLVFADILRANLRIEDVIGRLGGEEFAVLLPDLSPSAAHIACERVRDALQDTRIAATDTSFTVTVSIGVAHLDPEATSEAIFRQADTALYRAKSLGRNRTELAEV